MNNLLNETDIYAPKLLFTNEVAKIGENAKILIKKYEIRKNYVEDVVLVYPDKEILLGRFDQDVNILFALYNDGKILVGHKDFKDDVKDMKVIEVDLLYDVADDTFYSCTEKEALSIFDKNIDSSYLKHEDKYIYRDDIEKKSRIK